VSVSVQVLGLKELEASMAEMTKATGRNVLRRVARQALEPMKAEAVSLAPDDPTTHAPRDLKTSIAISEKQKSGRFGGLTQRTSTVTMYMGPTGGGYPQAMIAEFGAPPHDITIKRGGGFGRLAFEEAGQFVAPKVVHHPGSPALRYMTRAWEGGKDEMLASVAGLLGAEIDKAKQRAARKAARIAAKG
jgi:hypothetical protein